MPMIYSVFKPNAHLSQLERIDPATGLGYVKRSLRAFDGPCIVEAIPTKFFGGKRSQPYRSSLLVNPTWGQLYGCAAAQQRRTRDKHHCFLEDAKVETVETINGRAVKVLRLGLGS